jgi:hypothetical protein
LVRSEKKEAGVWCEGPGRSDGVPSFCVFFSLWLWGGLELQGVFFRHTTSSVWLFFLNHDIANALAAKDYIASILPFDHLCT